MLMSRGIGATRGGVANVSGGAVAAGCLHHAVNYASDQRRVPSALVGSAMRTDSWTLTGRDSELQFIAERLSSGESRSVVIAGPAGVGKTRLAREALAVAKRGGRVTQWAAGTSAAAAMHRMALACACVSATAATPGHVRTASRALSASTMCAGDED